MTYFSKPSDVKFTRTKAIFRLATFVFAALFWFQVQAEPRVTTSHPEDSLSWIQRGFKNPDVKTFRSTSISDLAAQRPDHFTHELTPTLVLFRHSGWSELHVGRAMERVGVIYAQCGIKIEFSKIHIVDPPFGLKSVVIDKPYAGLDVKIAEAIPTLPKPIFFFVEKSMNGYTAWATPRFHTPPGPFQDGAWMTASILRPAYWPSFKDKSYSVEAHELAHVLGNRNHVPDDVRNILGGTMGTGNDQITSEQCEAFRNFDLVKEIVPEITVVGSRTLAPLSDSH